MDISVNPTTQHSDNTVWNHVVKSLMCPHVQTLTSSKVDRKIWYTVKLSVPAQKWLRFECQTQWFALDSETYVGDGCFDISEKLYTALLLKYGE
jgi:hypothetical protein